MVASTGITPGCVQFLKNKKRFHTAWVKNGSVRARAARPFYPQEQTSSACPGMSVWCQRTKSLRDSPLRGGLPARAVTKGEIVDSGRRALS
jgi:hypothetical protein